MRVERMWVHAARYQRRVPEARLHAIDRSGRASTAAAYVARLVAIGAPSYAFQLFRDGAVDTGAAAA